MKMSEKNTELIKALVGFGKEITNPTMNKKNNHYNSKYTTLDAIVAHIRPVLANHGLAVFQDTQTSEDNLQMGSKTIIFHESGEWLESSMIWLPAYKLAKGGAKIYDAQGAGIAATYSRRYSLSSTLNLASEEDDDGNGIIHKNETRPTNRNQPAKYTVPNAEKEQRAKVLNASKAQQDQITKLVNEKRGEASFDEMYKAVKEHFNMDVAIHELKPAGAQLVIEHLEGIANE